MSEEMNNKIRLNEARREAVRNKLDVSDNMPERKGERGSEEREKINSARRSRIRSLYGGKKEADEARRRMAPFEGMRNPVAIAKKAKNIITAPTKFQATDIAIYGVAFSLALLKDLLDLVGVGSLPAIGTIITWCVSIGIGLILLFDGVSSSQRKVARRMTRRFLVLIAGTIVESLLFGLNFLPFETITVAIIYWMSLVDRKAR